MRPRGSPAIAPASSSASAYRTLSNARRWTQPRAERELAATGAQLTGAHVTPAFDPTTGETLPDGTAGPIAALTEDEAQLREVLRLEAIERRTRSLRSGPVAITYRRPDTGGRAPVAATAAGEPTAAPVPGADTPAQAGDQDRARTPLPTEPVTLLETISALQALDAQQTAGAELDAGRALPSGRQIQPPAVSPLGSTDTARIPQGDPLNPAIVQTPDDPPGWERIYEGSFVEAVLVNQLNGDFPGPVPRGRGRAGLLDRPAADRDPRAARASSDPRRPRSAAIKNDSPWGFTASSSPMVDGCRWNFTA